LNFVKAAQRVKMFNTMAGNSPSNGSLLDCWKQLKLQQSLVAEEAMEGDEACKVEDATELLDAAIDVFVVNTYLLQLLEGMGFDVEGATNEVLANNEQKFSSSYSYAAESKESLEEKGVPCYVEETTYNGVQYFCCKRESDGKIQKLKMHKRPELEKYVPLEFK
jgi:hypothetical protein